MKKTRSVLLLLLLAACATPTEQTAAVERMYVISCGENHTNDVSRWTPGVNVGKPGVFSNHCYLIKHAKGWMLWDSGNPDRLAAMPNGLTNPAGTITAFMRKPLAESLKEIGVAPADIKHFAMSHAHGDHSGNANLFTAVDALHAAHRVRRGVRRRAAEVRLHPGQLREAALEPGDDHRRRLRRVRRRLGD